jgi:hypothetical protein
LVFAGIGKILVGLAPENTDILLHTIGSLGFISSCIGLILLGVGVRKWRKWVANLSLILGIIGITGSLLLIPTASLDIGYGAAERLADYPMFVLFSVLGVYFMRSSK